MDDITLKYYKVNSDVKVPLRATSESACFDLYANLKDREIQTYNLQRIGIDGSSVSLAKEGELTLIGDSIYLIPTGLKFDIPEGYHLKLHIRSSLALKRGIILVNGTGIIDSDYTDEVFVMVAGLSRHSYPKISDGERIAQCELVKNVGYSCIETEYEPKQKGNRTGGFGSTGNK